ncbi:MAG: winged helix-turn-helix domain-containing protein [Alphaproteobacteria bacterium]|nr:MAG: winged helix-turn-helix domain-containing protein [Alphaproteobacteria bacterium]
MMDTLSNTQARRIALVAQGFDARRGTGTTAWPRLDAAIRQMGLLQLDSVNAIVRTHYMPGFSRLGAYDTGQFERRVFSRKHRQYFEYWAHEASLLPFELEPLMRWRMDRAARGEGLYKSLARFAAENPDYMAAVLREVELHGPLSASELSDPGERGGPWWGWNKGKIALEYLFWAGRVTTAERRGFERVYDLRERVIPADIQAIPTPAEADAVRALVALSARAHGIAAATDLRDYFRLPVADFKRALAELQEDGTLVPVSVDGWTQQAFLHRDARLPGRVSCRALLSPFDPLVWERDRTERLFGFHYRIEIYVPEPKRVYGYYVLPFLMDEKLVARLDMRANRQESRLEVRAAHAEPRINRGKVCAALADELRHMADWLGLSDVLVFDRGDLAASLQVAVHPKHG